MTRVDIHIAHSLEEVSKPSNMDPSLRWKGEVYRDPRRYSCEGRNLMTRVDIHIAHSLEEVSKPSSMDPGLH